MHFGHHYFWWHWRDAGLEGLIMNEPAFPQVDPVLNEFNPNYKKDRGMTLRDYFAAKAMQSMNMREDYIDTPANVIALDSYELADAMMKVR
jgi:hypothetical protein